MTARDCDSRVFSFLSARSSLWGIDDTLPEFEDVAFARSRAQLKDYILAAKDRLLRGGYLDCTSVDFPEELLFKGESVRPNDALEDAVQRSDSHVANVARAPPPGAVEATPRPQTRAVQRSETPADIKHADAVYFTCVSPRSVRKACEFQLRVSASSRQVQDDLLQTVSREEASERTIYESVPGALRIGRGKRVTVALVSGEGVDHEQHGYCVTAY